MVEELNVLVVRDPSETVLNRIAAFYKRISEVVPEDKMSQVADCIKAISKTKENRVNLDVYRKLSNLTPIILNFDEKDFANYFIELCVIILESTTTKDDVRNVKLIIGKVTASGCPGARELVALNKLFNVMPATPECCNMVIKRMIESALRQGNADVLLQLLDAIPAICIECKILDPKRIDLVNSIRNGLYELKLRTEALKAHFMELEYTTPDTETFTSLAADCVTEAIKVEMYYDFAKLIENEAVVKISEIEEYKIAHKAITILASGDLLQWKAFNEENPDFLTGIGAKADIVNRKARFLAASRFGALNLNKTVNFADFAAAIQVPAADTELWVIDAIRAGLIQAQMNQLEQTLVITRSSFGFFGQDQWVQLSQRLTEWKDRLSEMLPVLSNAKLVADQSKPLSM